MSQKIMVFGGTGNGGKALVAHLSTIGVQVVAVTRNLQKSKPLPNIKWIQADVFNRKTYSSQLSGCQAVFSILGTEDKKTVDIYSRGIPQIMKAMEETGVGRLILVTASHDHPDQPFIFKHVIRPTFLSHVFDDVIRLDAMLKNYKGSVEFTNLRPMKFEEGKRKKQKERMVESYTPESKKWTFETNTQHLAQAMVQCWKNNLFINSFVDIGDVQ